MCNKDCFNCTYEDCIVDGFTEDEVKSQNEFDKDLKHHSTEQQKKDSMKYYYRNREKCLERSRNYYHTHKEKFKEYDRLRKLEHPVSKEKRHQYYLNWKNKKLKERGLLGDK